MSADDKAEVETFRAAQRETVLLGNSKAMKAVRGRCAALGAIHAPLLILGPSGVGKELVARLAHEASVRAGVRKDYFVPVNCGFLAGDANMAADRLFWHAKGADTALAGAFEAANGGTLFLDEVAEIPLGAQPHFLRALEDGIVQRVGERADRKVDVRVIAATNCDLDHMVEEGAVRLDLYYRLRLLIIRIPALVERIEDAKPIATAVRFELRREGRDLELTDDLAPVHGVKERNASLRPSVIHQREKSRLVGVEPGAGRCRA